MKSNLFFAGAVTLLLLLPACSQKPLPETAPPASGDAAVVEPEPVPGLLPPTLDQVPPSPAPPEPAPVPQVSPPPIQAPKTPEGAGGLVSMKMNAQYNKYDMQAPVRNGSFEKWEVEGPLEWNGEFSYKKPGDPPDAMDIQMFPDTIDGDWGLRLMPLGTYLELWQDVKVDVGPGPFRLYCTAYIRNPVPDGIAFRVTYTTPAGPQVAEVLPVQSDNAWTRYYSEIALPEDTGHESVRFYIVRQPGVDKNIIIDGVSVAVVGAPKPEKEEDKKATPSGPEAT
jgi:hypothetical protein